MFIVCFNKEFYDVFYTIPRKIVTRSRRIFTLTSDGKFDSSSSFLHVDISNVTSWWRGARVSEVFVCHDSIYVTKQDSFSVTRNVVDSMPLQSCAAIFSNTLISTSPCSYAFRRVGLAILIKTLRSTVFTKNYCVLDSFSGRLKPGDNSRIRRKVRI